MAVPRLREMSHHQEKPRMRRPWEKHFRIAVVLSAVAFAVAEFWNLMAGSAIGAVALIVGLWPLFMRRNRNKQQER